jgi:hypothetical protein
MLVPACGSKCDCEGASSEAEPARGGREPSSEAEPARGGCLTGPLWWAVGATVAWPRRVCVLRLEVCFISFFAGFKQDSPGFLGDPQGCPLQ